MNWLDSNQCRTGAAAFPTVIDRVPKPCEFLCSFRYIDFTGTSPQLGDRHWFNSFVLIIITYLYYIIQMLLVFRLLLKSIFLMRIFNNFSDWSKLSVKYYRWKYLQDSDSSRVSCSQCTYKYRTGSIKNNYVWIWLF